VEVRKRPVVREEVRIGKAAYEEQQTASGTVRREELDVKNQEPRRAPRRDDDPETKR
jgi:stress response protein YsnF